MKKCRYCEQEIYLEEDDPFLGPFWVHTHTDSKFCPFLTQAYPEDEK